MKKGDKTLQVYGLYSCLVFEGHGFKSSRRDQPP